MLRATTSSAGMAPTWFVPVSSRPVCPPHWGDDTQGTGSRGGFARVGEGAVSAVRMVVNPHTDLDRVPPPPGSGVEQFHRRLAGYAVTPAVSLGAVAGQLGVGAVVVKDESHRCGLPRPHSMALAAKSSPPVLW